MIFDDISGLPISPGKEQIITGHAVVSERSARLIVLRYVTKTLVFIPALWYIIYDCI